jgi:regulator of sigma E protease
MTILRYILVALEVVLLFNLLIGIHEFGHFLAARWRGLKVERFAIWFGKPIWKKKVGGVEYALGWIPAGGYVSLPQMATMETIEGKSETPAEELPPISSLDKIIVAFAGPLFSFLLAVAFAVIVWQVGKPGSETDNSTVVGWVDPTGPAAKAGLLPGDTILEIDGHPVTHFSPMTTMSDSVTWRIVTSSGTNIAIKYRRDGREAMAYTMPFHRKTGWLERKALRQIKIVGAAKSSVFEIASNSPAALAGLKKGDEVVALNGQKIYSPLAVEMAQEAMSNTVATPLTLTVERDGKQFDCTLLPVKPQQPTNAYPLIGIMAWQGDVNVTLVHPGPWEQIKVSAGQIFYTVAALCSKGEVGVQQLGGPVMIVRVYYNLFQDIDGWRRVLWFSVILNVNLALINILPMPVLDGGHILLSLIEVIRRRPVSARVLNLIQNGFAALLIGFMVYIMFFDISDWIRSAHAERDVPVVFAAPAAHANQEPGQTKMLYPLK